MGWLDAGLGLVDVLSRAVGIIDNGVKLKGDVSKVVSEGISTRKSLAIACRVTTCYLDVSALGQDFHSLELSDQLSEQQARKSQVSQKEANSKKEQDERKAELDRLAAVTRGLRNDLRNSQHDSTLIQGAALVTSVISDRLSTAQSFSKIVDQPAVACRLGCALNPYGTTGSKAFLGRNFSILGLKEFFDKWYATHEEDVYPLLNIPAIHEDNPIFRDHVCPITQNTMRFPVTAPNRSGGPDHHFERCAIVAWLRSGHNTNPLNRDPLQLSDLQDNDEMRELIEAELTRLGIPF